MSWIGAAGLEIHTVAKFATPFCNSERMESDIQLELVLETVNHTPECGGRDPHISHT